MILLILSLLVVLEGKTQEVDSLINLIEANVNIDYKDTTVRNYGSIALYNDSLCHCISFAHQPNYSNIKPLVARLQDIAHRGDIVKLNSLLSLLIDQYYIFWKSKSPVPCNALRGEILEKNQFDTLLLKVQSIRYYLMVLEFYGGDEFLTFNKIMQTITKCNIYSTSNNVRLEDLRMKCYADYTNSDILNQKIEALEISHCGIYSLDNLNIEIFKNHISKWSNYTNEFIKKLVIIDPQKSVENNFEVNPIVFCKILNLFSDIKFNHINASLLNRGINFIDSISCSYRLFGLTDEPNMVQILENKYKSEPLFFREGSIISSYDSYIMGPYGQHYSRIFFKEKLKEKLPKDKYLLAISAIARVADQDVVDLLNREYRKQKDPRVKKEIVNAIYQAHRRVLLPKRPTMDWYQKQNALLDAKIEKLDKTKSNE